MFLFDIGRWSQLLNDENTGLTQILSKQDRYRLPGLRRLYIDI